MTYVKNDPAWVEGAAPGISAARLNHLETQFEEFQKMFNAFTILVSVADDTPLALSIPASRIVGRKATGNIVALTGAEALTLIGRVGVGNLGWTADKLLKGAGVGANPTEIAVPIPLAQLDPSVCSETEAATIAAAASLLGKVATLATLAEFQATPATGTFSTTPEDINDNVTTSWAAANAIGQYAEVDFGKAVVIDQWRIFGHNNQAQNGEWKIEYYGLDLAWHDWVTGIATNAGVWSALVAGAITVCSKIRLTCVAVDSYSSGSQCSELEVYHS